LILTFFQNIIFLTSCNDFLSSETIQIDFYKNDIARFNASPSFFATTPFRTLQWSVRSGKKQKHKEEQKTCCATAALSEASFLKVNPCLRAELGPMRRACAYAMVAPGSVGAYTVRRRKLTPRREVGAQPFFENCPQVVSFLPYKRLELMGRDIEPGKEKVVDF
jgi:hypothetical protein